MLLRRATEEAYAALRKRIIRETEAALLYSLLFPQRVPRIPTVEVGRAHFHPGFASRWWGEILGSRG